jgi:sulfane dehydrogenase subunit SoxC
VLLEEAGLEPSAKWLLAEGADAAAMSRSIPLEKAMEDTLVALYQNGERIRPEQGYPLRLVVPGFEGNMNVKWLRRIKVTDGPTYTKDETSKYTELMPDGKSRQFTYTMGVKSTITRPAAGLTMQGTGLYEVNGLAWSGHGAVTKVEVSADGGVSWAAAQLGKPVLSRCLTRFRIPWRWEGAPTVLQSRAYDDQGNVQPARSEWSKQYAAGQLYHCNAIQSWQIKADGSISNVYV